LDALFPGALLTAFRESPQVPAFELGDRTVSRGEMLALTGRLAGALREAGLAPGRGVAIATTVTPEAFAAYLAAYALGCRVVGVRPGYPPGQLADVLGTGVEALVADRPSRAWTGAGSVPVLPLEDLLAHPADDRPLTALGRPGDVAALTFTSGSTGRPKGCALTYQALSAHWSWQPARWSPVAARLAAGFGRYLLFGTLASMVVGEFLALCLLGGGTAIIPEDDGRPYFPYAIERYRITGSIITVPRLFQMLDVLDTDGADVSSLRALMVSGSPISARRLAAAARRLGPVVFQGYGQTEAGSISMLTPDDTTENALASVGRPHPRVEISVRDEDGRPVDTGEIWVRSPYVMAGYWGQPAETLEVLRDGWLRTRDLGRLDDDGLLHLTGRARDVIMVNAMVVYAGPIEQVLAGHPDIDEAYVVGAPDERTGEAVHAFVVPARGRVPDLDALTALVHAELGHDSVPRTVTVVPGVPVAPSGKPDKRALLGTL
jgi:acyl-CoA synthetase (AMP-forming)/AMP-acid ligase II